jgi:uncharacterized protein (TIGR01777 family)
MIVVLSGASGLIGSALKDSLHAAGHELRVLVRRDAQSPNEVHWDPDHTVLDAEALAGTDAVINLSGAGIGDRRWNESYQRTLVQSRVGPTRLLADTIAGLGDRGPTVFLSASAVGYYGDTGDRMIDESQPAGHGFLADLCVQWEAATAPAQKSGHTRVVHLRTGLVLSRSGGLLGKLNLLTKLGLGGPLGNGKQFQPWISLIDEVAAMVFLLDADVRGPVNLTGPDPVAQQKFAKALGHELHRPAIVPAPAVALRLILGGFADEGVLAGQRAMPTVLSGAGFTFTHPTLELALAYAEGQN